MQTDTLSRETWATTSDGLVVPVSYARSRSRPVAIDLFSGAGGFSLGIMQAGFHVIAAMDDDPLCAYTYMTNLGAYPCQFHFATPEDEQRMEKALDKELARDSGEILRPRVSGSAWISHYPEIPGVSHFFFGDIRKFIGQQILAAIGMKRGEVDLVFGSPPCQGFSMAGKRDVMDPRNALVFEFARVMLEIHPKMMVFENVPGITSMVTPAGVSVLDAFCQILADGGFGTLNALKRSLLASSGAGAALRGRPVSKLKDPKGAMQMSFTETGEDHADSFCRTRELQEL